MAVITRVEKLLSHTTQVKNMGRLTISDDTDEENCSNNVMLRVVATGKRGLHDNCSPCEPVAKKFCSGLLNDNNTSSTNSYCSD